MSIRTLGDETRIAAAERYIQEYIQSKGNQK